MPRPFGYRISFRVRHPTLPVTELLDVLPSTPMRSWQAGEPRATTKGLALDGHYADSYCTFDIAEGQDGKIVDRLIAAIGQLAPKRARLRDISATGGSSAFYIFWYPNGDTGAVFEASLLQALGDMGTALMLNVYDDRAFLDVFDPT